LKHYLFYIFIIIKIDIIMNKLNYVFIAVLFVALSNSSCVSKKKYDDIESRLNSCEKSRSKYISDYGQAENTLKMKQEQIADLKSQLNDCQKQRDMQVTQVGNLTVLSQSANQNINKTLDQLEQKDKYIHLLQAARTKVDSINLALAVNLKGVLKDGLDDEDVNVQIDKTVVMINLSDKMLYQPGSSSLTPQATKVLGKIAQIIASRPDLEVMVEGYTDNSPIKNNCIKDNWDLSVMRATSVVRVLQTEYNIDPNRLIAAGRGEFDVLASNDTPEGMAMNRRTRIVIMPKLDQFYDLLNPNNAQGK
jgi:chemotaxis protein MotB